MSNNNSDLVLAFPASVRDDALQAVSALPPPSFKTAGFSVCVGGEAVLIPYRIYHDPALINPERLTPLQVELLNCLLTRHQSGFVREKHLTNIICSNREWIPPFVVQLVGEYVIETLDSICKNLDNLDPQLYRGFLANNAQFLGLTKQRVFSYWDCYYRHGPKEQYAGFRIVERFDKLVSGAKPART